MNSMSDEKGMNASNRDVRALDRALDDLVRGRKRRSVALGSGLGPTVNRVFDLAAMGGMSFDDQPASQPVWWRFPSKQWVSIGSTAATILILAIALNATVPAFRNQNNGIVGTAVETSEAQQSERYDVAALSPEDCTVEPRSRQELLDILATVPGSLGVPDMVSPVGEGDENLIRELETTMRGWQACLRFNQSSSAMALESEEFIRRKIYPEPYVVEPYSKATLDEILDGYEATDTSYGSSTPIADAEDFWAVLQIDTSQPLSVSADGQRVDVYVRLVNPQTSFDAEWGYISLVMEGGLWRIAYTQLDIASGIRFEPKH